MISLGLVENKVYCININNNEILFMGFEDLRDITKRAVPSRLSNFKIIPKIMKYDNGKTHIKGLIIDTTKCNVYKFEITERCAL